ncbi:alpha/beta hydrolase [Mycobacterium florentinum]|uniref:Alpha/beta hydrolase n=2 Tax=Mycobacterium florentinum TaxID=292462 RepID=A0A1X1TYW1_MYCFL|nr:alpha/beta hydrolase fold domain-containing protein [Mycobacterium florentinum]MCV7409122.1 alpha/beta hydrolase [Mycobacterium florentinum]ORV49782.1 alpha/beta hydrolase [Mycobacterium florentinum]BBX78755.1 esterase [Mycobacterium florentinum]
MVSTQAKEFAEFFGALSARSANPNFDLNTVRDVIETMHLATKEPEGVTYAEVDAGGVEALWCIPVDADQDRVLLHSHLGGTVVASMYSDRKAAAHIAKAAGTRALVLNFRRSPENKFPAQIEDVRNAYNWLMAQGYRPENIASVGHSVGGNFAVGLALALRDEGAALPGAIVSISPWVDLTMTNETYTTNAERDRLLSRPLAEFFRSCWLDDTGVGFDDPRVSLIAADLSGLPPTAVFWGGDEVLAGEDAEFARRIEAAGNDVLVREVEGGQHSFILAAGWVPEVDEAIAEIGEWLRKKLGS